MSPQTSHYQTQAVTILAIATAVIGFGLFGSDQLAGIDLRGSSETIFAMVFKLLLSLHALGQYAVLLLSVSSLLRQESSVTGRQVAHGPLLQMALVMTSVALIFIIGIFEISPAANCEDTTQ